jgi:hypothetical protein
MKKLALLLSVVLAAGVASASPAARPHAAKHVAKASAVKTHDVTAEVVAVDAEKKTITIKGEPDNTTAPVEGKAIAALKTVKPGAKYVLTCRDDEHGAHQAVTAIHKAHEAKTMAKAPKKS